MCKWTCSETGASRRPSTRPWPAKASPSPRREQPQGGRLIAVNLHEKVHVVLGLPLAPDRDVLPRLSAATRQAPRSSRSRTKGSFTFAMFGSYSRKARPGQHHVFCSTSRRDFVPKVTQRVAVDPEGPSSGSPRALGSLTRGETHADRLTSMPTTKSAPGQATMRSRRPPAKPGPSGGRDPWCTLRRTFHLDEN